jgi:hypothetical protein
MLFPLAINAQQPADRLLLKDTAIKISSSDSSLATRKKKKKKKNIIIDTTNNSTATKAPAYTPYNSSPVKPPVNPGKDLPAGADILRTILIDRKKN